MVLGITGPFASGKSVAARFFRSRGFRIIDVDSIGHSVLELKAVRTALARVFGLRILSPGGRVDRGILGDIVFRDSRLLARLNRIVHPLMRKTVRDQVRSRRGDCVIDAALLFEMGLDKQCSKIILVTAPLRQILKRGKDRNSFGVGRVRAILASQWPVSVKRKKSDFIVENGSTLRAFNGRMAGILEALSPAGKGS